MKTRMQYRGNHMFQEDTVGRICTKPDSTSTVPRPHQCRPRLESKNIDLHRHYPPTTSWILEGGIWEPFLPHEAEGAQAQVQAPAPFDAR